MRKTPIHLRDVRVAQESLEKALLRAQAEGLDPRQTAARLAEAGFGHAHAYPVRFHRNKDHNVAEYKVGDLVVSYSSVSHLPPDVNTHTVSQLWRVERMFKSVTNWSAYLDDQVDLRNIRTGRISKNQYQASYYRAEIND